MVKKLYRSRTDRMIWGVCGGLAAYFNVDPTIVRVIAVLSIFVSGLGILAYLILAIVVPLESSTAGQPREVIRENVAEMKAAACEFGRQVRSGLAAESAPKEGRPAALGNGLSMLAVILIVVGILWLLSTMRLFWWLRWTYLWPIVLILVGIVILVMRRNR
ncbi:MAG: PspC domain-containing protein [Chloroflexi bacterium]|nr:PspC domain-containing protein [Chloroflexota bacterium]